MRRTNTSIASIDCQQTSFELSRVNDMTVTEHNDSDGDDNEVGDVRNAIVYPN